MKVAVLLSFLCAVASAADQWNDLRVTFGVNPLNTWDFDSLPRNLAGNMQSFTMKDDQCANSNGMFKGRRYWYKNDPATIILFDVNGYIAGIQTSVPKSSGWAPSPVYLGNYILEESDSYTLTVYFVDPSIICTTGRSAADFTTQGTGTGLYIQVGPNPLVSSGVFNVPMQESDAKMTKWGYGKCFYLMGQHYWYNVTKDMQCKDFVPYCLLYNKGVLNAFCFAVNTDLPSKRYEHPTPKVAGNFIDPEPDCFFSDPTYAKISTMHVYMTSNYLADDC